MTKEQKQLQVLAKWLKGADNNVDTYYDGAMESAIKYAVQECKQEIGSYIDEILNMKDKQLNIELED